MRKSAILDRSGQDTIKPDLPQDLASPSITPDLLPVIEQEKANRLSISHQLQVRALGEAPSASRLLEARYQLMIRKVAKTQ